ANAIRTTNSNQLRMHLTPNELARRKTPDLDSSVGLHHFFAERPAPYAGPLLRGNDMNARVLDGEIVTTRLNDVRAYDGVRTRRILAFVIDYAIVALLTIPFA